jgi:predicted secreted protein
MSWFTACVVYVLVWWTVLFAVLPFGTSPQPDADPHTGWRGAPARPLLGRKVLATTLISLLVWGAIMLVIRSPYLSFRS